MVNTRSAEFPLEAVAGATGRQPSEAFALLGNETRLAILLALWEEYDPHSDENAVPFSRIAEWIDYDDPGNLRYHLKKLTGQFVQQVAEREGYELREPGLTLVQTVIAGAGIRDVTYERSEIDEPCPFCGGPTTVCYRDGLVFWACSECAGSAPGATGLDGFLSAVPFEPAGVADRTPAELRAASWVASHQQMRALFDGLCPTCSGPVDGWLDCCTDHDSTDRCENCGKKFAAWARFECQICKTHSVSSPKSLVLFHPAVIGFYEGHGESIRVQAGDFESVQRVFALMDAHGMEVTATDPPRVTVTVAHADEEIHLTFDETVSVVDVSR